MANQKLSFLQRIKSVFSQVFLVSKTGSNIAITFGTNIFLAVLSLLSGSMLARWLGPTGRGELAAIQVWPTLIAVVGVVGIPEALVYYSAKRPTNAGRLLTTSIIAALIFCIPFTILGFFLMPIVLEAQPIKVIEAAQNYLWLVPLMAIVGMIPHPLRGINNIIGWNIVRSFPSIIWVVIILILGMGGIISSINVAMGYLVGLVFLIVPSLLLLTRWVSGPYQIDRTYIRPMLFYGFPAMLSVIPYTLNLRLDQMIMPAILQLDFLGYYAVAVAWSSALNPLFGVVPAILLPRVASEQKDHDQKELFAQITRLTTPFIVGISILVALISPIGIRLLFGSKFLPAVLPAVILSIAGGFLGFNQLLESGSMSLGKPKFVLFSELIGLVATFVLLWILLPLLNIVGAAIASLFSYMLISFSLLLILRFQTGLKVKRLIFPNRQDFTILSNTWVNIQAQLSSSGK